MLRGTLKPEDVKEPIPTPGEVRPPDELGDDALEVWAKYAPDLIRTKVLTAWDVEAFGAWCDAVVMMRHAREHLIEEGEVVDADVFDRNGVKTGTRSVRSNWLFVWKDANEVMSRIGGRFGLTPSDRAGIEVTPDGPTPTGLTAEALFS